MSETAVDASSCQDLMHTAVRSYLSTILSAAECIAKVCPEVGLAYQNRWRRLPQRIGFDVTSNALVDSGRMFQCDLERFAELASVHFGDGLQLVHKIGAEGGEEFERAVQETQVYANLLDELAESLNEIADLDAPPDVSGTLDLQSEGLRKFARQMRGRLLPALQNVLSIVRECRRALQQTEQDSILDASTGFLSSRGFRYELKARYEESQHSCVLLINCSAATENGDAAPNEEFDKITSELATRLGDQFRPWDCLGRVGPRNFAVIFEGSSGTARDRSDQIARSIGGSYPGKISVTATVEVVEIFDAESLLSVLAAVDKAAASGNAGLSN